MAIINIASISPNFKLSPVTHTVLTRRQMLSLLDAQLEDIDHSWESIHIRTEEMFSLMKHPDVTGSALALITERWRSYSQQRQNLEAELARLMDRIRQAQGGCECQDNGVDCICG